MSKVRAHVRVEGRVQGVYFRSYTRRHAESLGVTGWVRNCPDGRVEAIFEGEEKDVRRMVDWCRLGPPGAYVTDVNVQWEPRDKGEFDAFHIRYY